MISICPAILTDNQSEFSSQLGRYTPQFTHLDIDINVDGDDFQGKPTIDFSFVVNEILKYKGNKFTLHLMVSDPMEFINQLKENRVPKTNVEVMLHQESNAEEFLSYGYKFGVAIKAETNLNPVQYYNQFSEVQLMTIETGVQGNPFKPEVLKRVEWLRNEGYQGIISLDGSVNLETAELIKEHDVDRVSVGSYFSKANDVQAALDKLSKVLNG